MPRSGTARGFELFTEAEIRLLCLILGPAYCWDAARAHGAGEAILGSLAARAEVRRLLRPILRQAMRRLRGQPPDKIRLARKEIRLALEVLGYAGQVQPLEPLAQTEWRRLAARCWPGGVGIAGWVKLGGLPGDLPRCERAVIRGVTQLLTDQPALNRAFLDGSVWQRSTPEVMLHTEIAQDEVRPIVLNATCLADTELQRLLRKEFKRTLKMARHSLAPIGHQLLRDWVEAGFIGSPAGAMVSTPGRVGVEVGLPVLIPGNGVPLAVAVGALQDGECTLGIVMDHRVFDASHGGEVHQYLKREVPLLARD